MSLGRPAFGAVFSQECERTCAHHSVAKKESQQNASCAWCGFGSNAKCASPQGGGRSPSAGEKSDRLETLVLFTTAQASLYSARPNTGVSESNTTMLKVIVAVLGLGMLAGVSVAQAQIVDRTQPLGLEFGVAAAHTKFTTGSDSLSDSGYNLFAGYRFNSYVAAEVRYLEGLRFNLDSEGESLHASAYGIEASALGMYPITPNFGVFARVGGLNWHDRVDEANFFGEGSYSDSGTDFIWGVGLSGSYGNAEVRVEYNRSELGTQVGTTLQQVSLGVLWHL